MSCCKTGKTKGTLKTCGGDHKVRRTNRRTTNGRRLWESRFAVFALAPAAVKRLK